MSCSSPSIVTPVILSEVAFAKRTATQSKDPYSCSKATLASQGIPPKTQAGFSSATPSAFIIACTDTRSFDVVTASLFREAVTPLRMTSVEKNSSRQSAQNLPCVY